MIRHWRSCAAPSRTIDAAIIVEFVGASDFAARAGARVLRAISRSGHGAAPVQPVRGERYAIVIDGAEVGDLGQGESGRWRVASGQHTVGVREVGSLAMLANTVWGSEPPTKLAVRIETGTEAEFTLDFEAAGKHGGAFKARLRRAGRVSPREGTFVRVDSLMGRTASMPIAIPVAASCGDALSEGDEAPPDQPSLGAGGRTVSEFSRV